MELFNGRYIMYNAGITIDKFRDMVKALKSLGWSHIYDETVESIYKSFSTYCPYLEPSSRYRQFQVYSGSNHTNSYTKLSVEALLRSATDGSVEKTTTFAKNDVVIFVKDPIGSDWGGIGTITVPFKLGEVLIIDQFSNENTPGVKIKLATGWFPLCCFKHATEAEILAYAKKRYPVGTRYSAVNSDDGKNDGKFTWLVRDDKYSWHPSALVICASANIFAKGYWAPIQGLTSEDKIKRAKKEYPPGTEIVSAFSGSAFTIVGDDFQFNSDMDVVCRSTRSGPVIYAAKTDNWAKITKNPSARMSSSVSIEEVRRRYPVGTKFLPAHVEEKMENYCIVVNDQFKIGTESVSALTNEGSVFCGPGIHGSCALNRNVWHNGRWARIIDNTYTSPYPIGTEVLVVNAVRGAYGANGMIGKITDKPFTAGNSDSNLKIETSPSVVWGIGDTAEIKPTKVTVVEPAVSKKGFTDDELLDYARKNYPDGTIFKSTIVDSDKGIERIVKPYQGKDKIVWSIIHRVDQGRSVYAASGLYSTGGACSNPCIYSETRGWAPIVTPLTSRLTKFAIGDYVQYGREVYQIAGKSEKSYILDFPDGWDSFDPNDWVEGKYVKGKHYYFVDECSLKLAPHSRITAGTLKPGDSVRLIAENTRFGMGDIEIGDVGVFVRDDSMDNCVRLEFPSQKGEWISPLDILQLVSRVSPPTWMGGDLLTPIQFDPVKIKPVGWFEIALREDEEEYDDGNLSDLYFVADSMELPIKKKAKIKVPKKEIVFI